MLYLATYQCPKLAQKGRWHGRVHWRAHFHDRVLWKSCDLCDDVTYDDVTLDNVPTFNDVTYDDVTYYGVIITNKQASIVHRIRSKVGGLHEGRHFHRQGWELLVPTEWPDETHPHGTTVHCGHRDGHLLQSKGIEMKWNKEARAFFSCSSLGYKSHVLLHLIWHASHFFPNKEKSAEYLAPRTLIQYPPPLSPNRLQLTCGSPAGPPMFVRHNNFWRVASAAAGLVPFRGAGPGALGTVNTAPSCSIPLMWAVILQMTSARKGTSHESIGKISDNNVKKETSFLRYNTAAASGTFLRFSDILNLLHTSYIIHHTSYIIHHTSYIIHHTSYIIHHTPYIILSIIVWGKTTLAESKSPLTHYYYALPNYTHTCFNPSHFSLAALPAAAPPLFTDAAASNLSLTPGPNSGSCSSIHAPSLCHASSSWNRGERNKRTRN